MMMTKHNPQSGNALWFILIAIVLLGGLTVLMTRTSSYTDDSGDYERGQIQLSDFVRFAKSVEVAVTTLKSQGCSENDLNFEASGLTGHDNTTAPGNGSCDVFSDKGGGLTYRPIPTTYLDPARSAEPRFGQWVFTGGMSVAGVGLDTSTNNGHKELLIIAPFLTKELCMKVNTLVGVSNVGANPPSEDNTTKASFLVPFTGTFGGGVDIDGNGNGLGLNIFTGKASGCTTAQGENSYYFYHILIRR